MFERKVWMEFHKSVLPLYYSRIFSIPIASRLLYKLQEQLLKNNIINFSLASAKETECQRDFFEFINRNYNLVIVKSYKFARSIRFFSIASLLDLKTFNYKSLGVDLAYRLVWSLVFVKFISSSTRKTLEGFVTKDCQVKDMVIIPVHFDLGLISDFILQTANELEKRGYIVVLVPYLNSRWFFKPADHLNYRQIKRKFTRDGEGVFIYFPLRVFPLRFHKYHVIRSIDRKISNYILSFWVKRVFSKPLLWCFDYRDEHLVAIARNSANRIYDCVDYWTALDKKTAWRKKKEESGLIKAVDHFVVNSMALYSLKKGIRKPDLVVPQGFDQDSYQSKEVLYKFEKREINKVRRIFKRIPKPVVGYIGRLNFRLDYDLLSETVERCSDVSFVFTDSREETVEDVFVPELSRKIKSLLSQPNVYLLPKTRSKRVVKEMIKYFDIGMIPYDVAFDFNRYCYPMKLFEYFYMGKPVVSTPIEELKRFPKFVKIGANSKEWEQHIRLLLSKPWSTSYKGEQRRLTIENSWESKLKEVSRLINVS